MSFFLPIDGTLKTQSGQTFKDSILKPPWYLLYFHYAAMTKMLISKLHLQKL